jgi:regulator of cell morphogenesis and NO signaling
MAPRRAIGFAGRVVMEDQSSSTVAEIVLENPASVPVFQRHRIDFCCAGGQTLQAACARRGLDVGAVQAELEEAKHHRTGGSNEDPRQLTTRALLTRIIGKHHGYLRRVLPAVALLTAKVARVHGDRQPKLPALAAAVEELVDVLEPHMALEEEVLFPAMAQERGVTSMLGQMLDEHRSVADVLDRIFEASDGFQTPSWACASYRALAVELRALDADLREHVHLENHVLLPRFIE